MNHKIHKVTLIKGDGIGPEIVDATVKILKASGAPIVFEEAIVGERVYLGEDGLEASSSGINCGAWDIIKSNKTILKGPITTPSGGGYKSLNVTLRKELALFANVRPVTSYYPFIRGPEKMDLVIVRENEEDLYAGVEYRQTHNVYISLKILSKLGSLRACDYAFAYAKAHGRKKVTCMIKDNIMKLTDGMFYAAFQAVAANYPEIENERYIIDIGAARIASVPERFDVIVTENLYGDIISDIASEVSGSIGLSGSANLGERYAMFEAVHGSAPDIAGENIANPAALINAAILMLEHIKLDEYAEKIRAALKKTIEDGMHTADIYMRGKSKGDKPLGTSEFADYIVENLDHSNSNDQSAINNFDIRQVGYAPSQDQNIFPMNANLEKKNPRQLSILEGQTDYLIRHYEDFLDLRNRSKKILVGADIFLSGTYENWEELVEKLEHAIGLADLRVEFTMISIRGLAVWTKKDKSKKKHNAYAESERLKILKDHWRARFLSPERKPLKQQDILDLFRVLTENNFEAIKMETLFYFDDKAGFLLGQGE